MPKKEKIGTVVSDKMDKTIVVAVTQMKPHAKYGKFQQKTVKFQAHDENNEGRIGDRVRIIESSRFSKNKSWRLETVLEKVQEV